MRKTIITFLLLLTLSFSLLPKNTSALTFEGVDQAAVADYNKAKSQYLQAYNFYTSARRDYKVARANYIKYENAESLEGAMDAAKDMLIRATTAMIKYLVMLEAKTTTIKGISETDRQNALADIRNDISWLEERRAMIPSATTKEQIIEEADKVRLHWFKIRIHAKSLIGQISIFRINWAIGKGYEAREIITKQIQTWNKQGKDTTQAQKILDDLDEKIILVESERDKAQTLYNEVGTKGSTTLAELDTELREADRIAKEADVFIRKANQYVLETYRKIKEVAKHLR